MPNPKLNYPGTDGKNIKNGLIQQLLYETPPNDFIVQNLIRLITENQNSVFNAFSSTWAINPALEVIPADQFYYGKKLNFNAKSCNIVYTRTPSIEGNSVIINLIFSVIMGIGVGTNSTDIYKRSDYYLTTIEGILKTYLLTNPQELVYGYPGNRTHRPGVEVSFLGGGLANIDQFVDRPVGLVPTIKIQASIRPVLTLG